MNLISYWEALERVRSLVPPVIAEHVGLPEALGRVLAIPVTARCDLPPFDNSAVDGYALLDLDVRAARTTYRLGKESRAGDPPLGEDWEPGTAVRVFTGAPVPQGTGAVVMQEIVRRDGDRLDLDQPPRMGAHIRRRAEEHECGDPVLEPPLVLGPSAIAAAAAAGADRLEVARRPLVGILATGSELAAPGDELRAGQVYEANAFGLAHAVRSLGLPEPRVERVADEGLATQYAIDRLADEVDVLVVTGGVSVGDYDLVRPALATAGFETAFWGVRMKPGKPVYLGVRQGKVSFGLPGNPLSTLVTWSVLVRPYLLGRLGLPCELPRLQTVCGDAIERKAGRLEFVPASWGDPLRTTVRPMGPRGSHRLDGAVRAEALIVLEEDQESVAPGETVTATPWVWGLP
ncbi:MAG: molybdopterin molybdotransferase MoeA [Fimbriimonadaceae bacterium]|nr:molybdopterin molybdotransferase MoeA [Fimbriimonadaceae bacterium]